MKWVKGAICCLAVALIVLGALAAVPAESGIIGEIDTKVGPSALFLNVGKADAALFFLGEQTYLIDTGTKDAAPAVLRALTTYQVTHLSGVLITHTDKDHVGGLKQLLESGVQVDELYAPKLHSEKSDEKHPVYKAAQDSGIPLNWLSAGDVITVDEETRFTVLGPISRDLENENNNSLVLHLETAQGNMLLTGDMEFAEEEELIQAGVVPQAAVLKVGHHGEDDASSQAFLARVKPQWAVISTSTAEEKDTPSPKVMRMLWNLGAGVAVTQVATCGIWVTLSEGVASVQAIDYNE